MPQIYPRKLPLPPSAVTGPLAEWLRQLWAHVESGPVVSVFSGTTPVSNVSGLSGDIAVNIGSASTDSRVWVLGGGNRSALTNQGWVVLHVGQP